MTDIVYQRLDKKAQAALDNVDEFVDYFKKAQRRTPELVRVDNAIYQHMLTKFDDPIYYKGIRIIGKNTIIQENKQ